MSKSKWHIVEREYVQNEQKEWVISKEKKMPAALIIFDRFSKLLPVLSILATLIAIFVQQYIQGEQRKKAELAELYPEIARDINLLDDTSSTISFQAEQRLVNQYKPLLTIYANDTIVRKYEEFCQILEVEIICEKAKIKFSEIEIENFIKHLSLMKDSMLKKKEVDDYQNKVLDLIDVFEDRQNSSIIAKWDSEMIKKKQTIHYGQYDFFNLRERLPASFFSKNYQNEPILYSFKELQMLDTLRGNINIVILENKDIKEAAAQKMLTSLLDYIK